MRKYPIVSSESLRNMLGLLRRPGLCLRKRDLGPGLLNQKLSEFFASGALTLMMQVAVERRDMNPNGLGELLLVPVGGPQKKMGKFVNVHGSKNS